MIRQTGNSEILDSLPPQDLDAERGVLGSVLLDPKMLDEVAPILKPADFHADAHRRLYGHLTAMHDAGQAIDTTLLIGRLTSDGELEAVGGMAGVAEILQSVAVAAHAVHYARKVKEKSILRSVLHAGTSMVRDAYEPGATPEEILSHAEAILGAVETGDHHGEPVALDDAMHDALEQVERIAERKEQAGRLTGVYDFDQLIGGLFPGELIILAARPGIGKTSLAVQIGHHVAKHHGLVYFVSLEMRAQELATRLMCGDADVESHLVRTGRIGSHERNRLVESANRLHGSRLLIHDRPGMSVADIRRSARRLVKDGLALIAIDYLQLLIPADRRAPREQQVALATRELKGLARELNVPVLCLCQLNRQADGERPRLSHLRESGAIEQDADMVCFLYQKPKEDQGNHNAVLEIAKNRNGQTLVLGMFWEASRTRFRSANEPEAYTEFTGYGD